MLIGWLSRKIVALSLQRVLPTTKTWWSYDGLSLRKERGGVWNVADLAAEASITHFELGSVVNAVHLVVSERNGEGLKVFELVL